MWLQPRVELNGDPKSAAGASPFIQAHAECFADPSEFGLPKGVMTKVRAPRAPQLMGVHISDTCMECRICGKRPLRIRLVRIQSYLLRPDVDLPFCRIHFSCKRTMRFRHGRNDISWLDR